MRQIAGVNHVGSNSEVSDLGTDTEVSDLGTNPEVSVFLSSGSMSTSPPPCADALTNCKDFQADSCTNAVYRPWAIDNCRLTCNLCGELYPLTSNLNDCQDFDD